MEKVLVTGATGFVGANIVRRLIKEDYEVHTLSRESSNMWRLESVLEKIIDHKADLKEYNKLSKIMHEICPDYIIHLAIYGGRPSQNNEKNILDCNFLGTVNLINALQDINYKCFINTGSSSEYGIKDMPMKENSICKPINMYGVTKSAATNYCNYRARMEDKNIGTIRLFSPFGKYEDKGRLIPDLILGSLVNKNVKLANPNAVRDFIYIEDVCDIYLKILKEPNKLKGEIFNIGYGRQHSVKKMSKIIEDILSEKIEFEFNILEGRKEDTKVWVANIKKIDKVYNWKPSYNMKTGLKKSIDWFKRNINLYNTRSKI